ncbi:MAG: hypothetical protein U5L03_08605 [Burkholderiaceae bacterium]|nr:hypothetical protein [Burkholderiaceae bacterium]
MTQIPTAPAPVESPSEAGNEMANVVQRPDGWYWLADDGRQEVGPFVSAVEALADMRAGQEGAEPAAELRETEDALGVSDWIDPETHALAEANAPHIEDR